MALSEEQIEDIIYDSPWILGKQYLKVKIKGSRGQYGRQVNIGLNKDRYIDLLFKDISDNRPVVIELKKNRIQRQDITQALEYKALINILSDTQKSEWEQEFGLNYYSPKIILIGKSINNEEELTANLAGVEVKVFGKTNIKELGFSSFKDMKLKIKEWEDFRKIGNTLIDRETWIDGIIDSLNEQLPKIDKNLNNIKYYKPCKNTYTENYLPFIDFSINITDKDNEENLLGFYEFFDNATRFNSDYIYCDLGFIASDKFENENEIEKIEKRIKSKFRNQDIQFYLFPEVDPVVLKIRKDCFNVENKKYFNEVFNSLIKKSIELYNELNNNE